MSETAANQLKKLYSSKKLSFLSVVWIWGIVALIRAVLFVPPPPYPFNSYLFTFQLVASLLNPLFLLIYLALYFLLKRFYRFMGRD